ncbi:MAG: hypothetical protein DCC68_24105 [Planctomycetota bacterium]|nr:MAG: hypothetical protein DCC68_24105 [Planctomycetota bacterium]
MLGTSPPRDALGQETLHHEQVRSGNATVVFWQHRGGHGPIPPFIREAPFLPLGTCEESSDGVEFAGYDGPNRQNTDAFGSARSEIAGRSAATCDFARSCDF